VLLALTIVISLFGIVNTLVLAIHERTRELGMLRAIGTSRRQVKRIVRYESVITAMIGSVLGVVLGGIFAVLVTIPLKSEGFTISIPILQLVILLVVAAIFGVIAAIWPARRAAKLDVLRALAYE
jgi:putative ABC transport system permease protein